MPTIQGSKVVYPETPEFMVDGFKRLADLGINIMSGCCGTNPEHVRALAQALRG